jgi:uncharacterized membrane protein (UPF0127 family)
VVERLEVADGFWSRLWGLQFRKELPAGSGLLLVPCSSIHTCWMRFAIDLVCLDSNGTVLAVKPNIRPWRVAFPPRGTHAILELAAGQGLKISAGSQLAWWADGEPAARRGLHFLGRSAHEPAPTGKQEREEHRSMQTRVAGTLI